MTRIDLSTGQRKALLVLLHQNMSRGTGQQGLNYRACESLARKGLVDVHGRTAALTESGEAVAKLVRLEEDLELRLNGLQRYMLYVMGEDLDRGGEGQIIEDTGNVHLNPSWSGALNRLRAAGIVGTRQRIVNGMQFNYLGIVGAAKPLAEAAFEATDAIARRRLAEREEVAV